MNVLLVGGGGREHALAWKLSQSPGVKKLFCAPGNPGIAKSAQVVPIAANQFDALVNFAKQNSVGLVVVGPEEPLAGGLVDRLEEEKILAFGPKKHAAQLEADKWFAKELMRHQAVPTAEARLFTDANAAAEYVRVRGDAVVVKAAGLAKGKGVMVCHRTSDALEAIDKVMKQRVFGEAGSRVVIEELLHGPECSMLAFVSGRDIFLMESAQDHKPVEDGDTGPMTGGMGAFTPTPSITESTIRHIERDIFVPVLDGLAREGIDYRGVLYAGLMLTTNGPKVLEFNCRFGDPETQPLMMRMKGDLLEIMLAVARGKLEDADVQWDPRPAVCVVAASSGYPGSYKTGAVIEGIEQAESDDVKVFQSGTARRENRIVTDGGRVLSVTALGKTIADAQQRAYDSMAKIRFDGMHYRRDIGRSALLRR